MSSSHSQSESPKKPSGGFPGGPGGPHGGPEGLNGSVWQGQESSRDSNTASKLYACLTKKNC